MLIAARVYFRKGLADLDKAAAPLLNFILGHP